MATGTDVIAWLRKLRDLTNLRDASDARATAIIQAYVEPLSKLPGDRLKAALEQWPETSSKWPEVRELVALCQPASIASGQGKGYGTSKIPDEATWCSSHVGQLALQNRVAGRLYVKVLRGELVTEHDVTGEAAKMVKHSLELERDISRCTDKELREKLLQTRARMDEREEQLRKLYLATGTMDLLT